MAELTDLKGIGKSTAESLDESGYSTVKGVATATPPELSAAANMGEGKAGKLITRAQEAAEDLGFEVGTDLLERRKEVERIPTGSENLDEMLGGGVETGSITEFYGEFRTGKTQLSHQLSVNAQTLDGESDRSPTSSTSTRSTLQARADREMAEAVGMDADRALDKIHVARASTTDHQMLLAEKTSEIAEESEVKLVVVDGLMSNFRTEYVGRGALAERQQKLGKHLNDLHDLAERHNLAVFLTNHVQSDPNSFFGDPTKPIGGHVLGHSATARVYLRKSKKESRKAKLVDHPALPPDSVKIRITGEGIRD